MEEIELAETSKYLTQLQIDAAKEELERMGENVQDVVGLLTTIDHYVRANGKADAEYEAIFTLVTTLDLMQSTTMNYDDAVKVTYPILSAIGIYDFLLVTGVLSPTDVKQFKDGKFAPFGGNGVATA
ncbi:MAG: hypothetical protein K6E59_01365 [Bacilli bacterium]|nr:hypothetical protein [Bacilli bacterium]